MRPVGDSTGSSCCTRSALKFEIRVRPKTSSSYDQGGYRPSRNRCFSGSRQHSRRRNVDTRQGRCWCRCLSCHGQDCPQNFPGEQNCASASTRWMHHSIRHHDLPWNDRAWKRWWDLQGFGSRGRFLDQVAPCILCSRLGHAASRSIHWHCRRRTFFKALSTMLFDPQIFTLTAPIARRMRVYQYLVLHRVYT